MSTIETNRSWTHFRVDRGNPRYCHVTFDHPPIKVWVGHCAWTSAS